MLHSAAVTLTNAKMPCSGFPAFLEIIELGNYQLPMSAVRICKAYAEEDSINHCTKIYYVGRMCDICKFRSNLADIVVVGADRFFVTNFVFTTKRWTQLVELALQSSFGSIVYYDGKKSSYLEKLATSMRFAFLSRSELYGPDRRFLWSSTSLVTTTHKLKCIQQEICHA
uniref:Uncharacterized protein n=1 Tax=Parascaris equorum TaxID=6256 RepID=A0A914SFX3_PAREQ